MAIAISLQNSLGTLAHAQALLEKGDVKRQISVSSRRSALRLVANDFLKEKGQTSFSLGMPRIWPSACNMATQATVALVNESIASKSISPVQSEKKDGNKAVFPNGFESLIMEVCDKSDVAELKIKVGAFEMHICRNIEKSKGLTSITSSIAPPVTSKTMVNSIPAVPPAAPPSHLPKYSPAGSSNPFTTKFSSSKTSKFGLLEASADGGLLFVTSPKVGLFRRSRVVKGKSGHALCEEGRSIKEGQAVCFLEQLGTQQPVMSEVSGEIVKILWNDGEPVGYGDPLIAILPSFHGIK